MEKSVRITIQGRSYALRMHEENIPLTEQLAHDIDQRIGGFRKRHTGPSELTATVMAALKLAEEMHVLQKKYEALQTQYEEVALAHELHLEELDGELDTLVQALDTALLNGEAITAEHTED